LDVCATQACADWREVVRTKLAEGQTADEIKDYFELQYGPRALAEPPTTGFPLAVWILPVLAMVIGAVFFGRYMRGLRAKAVADMSAVPESTSQVLSDESGQEVVGDDDYRSRVESELRDM
jgi:cytochrome c-type biogenesis protein CcmH